MSSYRDFTSQRAVRIDPDITYLATCTKCGETFPLPVGVPLTRGSRPCGWSH